MDRDGGAGGTDGPLWLLINLDRAPDRLVTMDNHLRERGIVYRRVAAIDGRTVPENAAGVDPQRFRRCHGRSILPGDIGCSLSHLQAMRCFLETGARHAVVLEDDVEVLPDLAGVVGALCQPEAPDDWDMVKLERHRQGHVLPLRTLRAPYSLGAMLTRMSGSAAYLVNRRAAEAYLAHLLPLEVPFDHAFDRGWALDIRVRVVSPSPARAFDSVNGAPSSIATQAFQKVRGFQKLPVLGWRAKTETARVACAVVAYLSSRRPRAAALQEKAG